MLEQFYYFAYGSNMSSTRLKLRCPSAEALGIGKLADWKLVWNKESIKFDGSAKANILPFDGTEVLGVLYSIKDDDGSQLATLRHAELGYKERKFSVQSAANALSLANPLKNNKPCLTYIADSPAQTKDCCFLPFDWYKEHILGGAKEHALPEAYWQQLEEQRAKPVPDKYVHDREIKKEWEIIKQQDNVLIEKGKPQSFYKISVLPE